jgi:hypothetical protein
MLMLLRCELRAEDFLVLMLMVPQPHAVMMMLLMMMYQPRVNDAVVIDVVSTSCC